MKLILDNPNYSAEQLSLLQKWVDFLATNPPKIKGRLEVGVGRCCLGHLCHVANQNGLNLTKNYDSFYGYITYDGCDVSLPTKMQTTLNFSHEIIIKPESNQFVSDFLNSKGIYHKNIVHWDSLAAINDHSDINHSQMAELITLLINKNYLKQI